MLRLFVTGTKELSDYKIISKYLDKIITKTKVEIISTHDNDVELLAERYAKEHNLSIKIFHTKWDEYGKRALTIRDLEIVRYTDSMLLFYNKETDNIKKLKMMMDNYDKQYLIIQK